MFCCVGKCVIRSKKKCQTKVETNCYFYSNITQDLSPLFCLNFLSKRFLLRAFIVVYITDLIYHYTLHIYFDSESKEKKNAKQSLLIHIVLVSI